MSRYIDADKLQESFKELHGGKRSLLIDTEPTVDVRKNIHAQKVIGGGERDGATCWFECSHCHGTVDLQDMFCKHCGAVMQEEKKLFDDIVDQQPTVDAVEVVRCKDCKHYVLYTLFGHTQGWCERLCDEFDKSLAHGTEEDDFCSHGERADK